MTDTYNIEYTKQLLEPDIENSDNKQKPSKYNNLVPCISFSMAFLAIIFGIVAINRVNHISDKTHTNNINSHINSQINPYINSDCLGIKTEIYHNEFCQATGVKPYSNQSQAQKNMCSELSRGVCEITDEFFKDLINISKDIKLNPCQDSIENIRILSNIVGSMATSNNAFSLKSYGLSINEDGNLTFGDQQLLDWNKDCQTKYKAPLGNCFDICVSNKLSIGIIVSMRPSEQCCNQKNRIRRDNDWTQQIEADLSPSDELKKAVCKYAPEFINYLGDKGADWICSKGESLAANAACEALLDTIDIGWIPDVDELCSQLLIDGLNALDLDSECDNLAEEGVDYITNFINNELTSYLC